MNIPVHHNYNSQSYTYFSCRYHHYKKNKQLRIAAHRCIFQVMHFGKCHQQQVHRIQHKFNAHENNDRIAPCQHSYNTNAEQRN